MVWLTVRCYRRDGQAHRRLRGVLAGIRIAVILLLIAILLQPAVVLRLQRTLYSTVLVLFDDSLSMAQKDRWQGAEESGTREARESLGKALGGESPADVSRSEIVQKILLAPGGPVEALRKDHPVELLAFSTDRPGKESYTRSVASLPRSAAPTAPTTQPVGPSLKAGGYETNLSAALRDALERFQGRRIAAVVVVSDGQPTNADAMDQIATAVEYAGSVPRYAVMVGDPTPPKDVRVLALRAPREVRAGAPAEFRVLLAQRNLTGRKAEVEIYRREVGENWPADLADLKPVATKDVELTGQPAPTRRPRPRARRVSLSTSRLRRSNSASSSTAPSCGRARGPITRPGPRPSFA